MNVKYEDAEYTPVRYSGVLLAQVYTEPVCLHVNGYVLVSGGETFNGTPGKLATAATAFMAYIGGYVMAMISMPAVSD